MSIYQGEVAHYHSHPEHKRANVLGFSYHRGVSDVDLKVLCPQDFRQLIQESALILE